MIRSMVLVVCAILATVDVARAQQAASERPLPPAPGTVPLRSRARHYTLRSGATPRFAAPRGFDPAQLANLGATLAGFAPELWSCTRRRGAAIDPSVAPSVPAVFREACFYEGYETLTILGHDEASGFSRIHGGGVVPTSALHRRRPASDFRGALIADGRLPAWIAREGDTVRFDEVAQGLEGARPIAPPPAAWLATVRPGERWIYIDRDDQVLVAFVGTTPVMATLVSTGRRGFSTSLGEYRIIRKLPEGSMRDYDPGRGDRPYFIAGIPDIQYFHEGQAFHGVFWHDRFGTRASHGCVNLSLADAQWLFDFTDVVPDGDAAGEVADEPSTEVSTPWRRGREGRGNRVFVHGST